MPHSSGGGSRSGGSHGGGHHGGSHGGSRGGGSSGPRMSRRAFPNSHRYRYRRMGGGYGYVYASSMPQTLSAATSIASFVFQMIFMLPFIAAGIFITYMAFNSFGGAEKIDADYNDTGIYIEDNIGVIDNYDALNSTLSEFQDLTGICAYIITVYDSSWENYNNLESYAYELYVNHFYDEQHFLIVYSEPDSGFVDWSWEAMQGDETDAIITEEKFADFQEALQRYLTMHDYSVGEAFQKAFNESKSYIMKNSNSFDEKYSLCFFAFIWDIIVLFFIFTMIKTFVAGRRKYERVNDDGTPYTGGQSYQGGMNYNAGQNYQGGMNYNAGQNYQGGMNYNAGQSYQGGMNYNAGQNYSNGMDYTGGQNGSPANPYSGDVNRSYNLNGEENGEL